MNALLESVNELLERVNGVCERNDLLAERNKRLAERNNELIERNVTLAESIVALNESIVAFAERVVAVKECMNRCANATGCDAGCARWSRRRVDGVVKQVTSTITELRLARVTESELAAASGESLWSPLLSTISKGG